MEEMEAKKVGRKSRAEIQAEMTSSPEFKALLNEAVAEHLASLAPQIEAARAGSGNGKDVGDLMDRLAMSISELTTQGTSKVKVSPEEMQRRQKSRQLMVNLIIEARAENKVPTYQLRNKVFMNNEVHEPFYMNRERRMVPTEIDFWGIPNDAMVPVNDVAKAIFGAYRDSVGVVSGRRGVINPLPGEDEIAMTPGGLVVRNGVLNQSMRAHNVPDRPAAATAPMAAYENADVHDFQPMVVKSDKDKMAYREERILGTLAQPARVNA